MKLPVYALGALLLLAAPVAVRAQCLPLAALVKDAADGRLSDTTLPGYLPSGDWEAHHAAPAPYWVFVAPPPDASEVPASAETRVELRHPNQQPQPDVVLRTTYKDCFAQARADLRRLKLTGEPVTCLQCEATRYTGPGFVLTLYDQQELFAQHKAPHPFVLVLHSTATPAPVLAGH